MFYLVEELEYLLFEYWPIEFSMTLYVDIYLLLHTHMIAQYSKILTQDCIYYIFGTSLQQVD